MDEDTMRIMWLTDPPQPENIGGSVFVDGSCMRRVVRETSRASWSVFVYSPSKEPLCQVSGPVWAHMPQTPQAGEFC
eukprot:1966482-Pyramimonas_sp.AAC.1